MLTKNYGSIGCSQRDLGVRVDSRYLRSGVIYRGGQVRFDISHDVCEFFLDGVGIQSKSNLVKFREMVRRGKIR